jgi:hypothetical protein
MQKIRRAKIAVVARFELPRFLPNLFAVKVLSLSDGPCPSGTPVPRTRIR